MPGSIIQAPLYGELTRDSHAINQGNKDVYPSASAKIRRVQAKSGLDFAYALTAGMIQVQYLHGGAALGAQAFDLKAIKPEMFRPNLQEGME
jgi:hypothetical protein